MNNLVKILFYSIGFIILLILFRYRSNKFLFIKDQKIKEYPITRYRIGSFILILWMITILFGMLQEVIFNKTFDSKMFLVPFLPSIIYSLFGATPSVTKSKYKIDLILDLINIGSYGLDWLGSWLGKYENGVIVYFYLIDYDSIEISKLSKEEIIFSGREKQEDIPINVTLRSKVSINYFYPLLSKINGDYN